jgi:glycogen debranching enzyme
MAEPWTLADEPPRLGPPGATVTLVEGAAFCISDLAGDVLPGTPHGLYLRDTRFLSRLEVRVNGGRLDVLGTSTEEPFSATFVARARPRDRRADASLLVFRSRYVGRGMREDLRIRNYGREPAYVLVEILFDADFADTFAVKEGRAGNDDGDRSCEVREGALSFSWRRGATSRGVRIGFGKPPRLAGNLASFEVIVPARGEWEVCLQVAPVFDGEEVEPRYQCGQPVERATPHERLARWRRQVPLVETDHEGLRAVVARSAEDLGALRLFDPDYPERAVVAAGAPWFMTLFGRDSILTSYMALLIDPDLALGVLQTLARFQGSKLDPLADEEPGRILHEMRFAEAAGLSLGGGSIYYGSADATPLFVMLLGELRRWGLAREVVDELLPHADRALDWVEHYGDRDGDGYVEYQRASDRGLLHQGWKDSFDGIRYADGRVASPPVALCEVQAYVYAAYLARAYFAEEVGDQTTMEHCRRRAAALKAAFNRDFWLPDRGWFAVGLGPDKEPIDSLTSNIGHCLWAGIVDEDKAAFIARHLVSDELWSGFGVRTLARSMGGYSPISYHCGSVWPHDTAICAAGLMRYGYVAEAQQVVGGLLDAAAQLGGRLPELFSGLDRTEMPTVVAYPTSCSPQAWSAASALLVLRTLLRLDPWVPHGKVWLAPALPPEIGYLRVDRVPLGGGRVTIEVRDGKVEVSGLPPHLELVAEPRRPGTAAL